MGKSFADYERERMHRDRQREIRRYHRTRELFEKSKNTPGFKAWYHEQYEVQNHRCAWCYKPINLYKGTQVDHVWSILGGGNNDYTNLVLCCEECNKRKGATDFNFAAYNNTVLKLRSEGKFRHYRIVKDLWRVPAWIKKNKFTKERIFTGEDVYAFPDERNVWEQQFITEHDETYDLGLNLLAEPIDNDNDNNEPSDNASEEPSSKPAIDGTSESSSLFLGGGPFLRPENSMYQTFTGHDKPNNSDINSSAKIWLGIIIVIVIIIIFIGATKG